MNWQALIDNQIRENVSLKSYNTMKVGGSAKYFAEPKTFEELQVLQKSAQENKIPVFILGKGSNTVFSDNGFNGLVICLIHFQDQSLEKLEENRIMAGSGVHLYRLAKFALQSELGGLEFAVNIPGTVGGAIYMNAGFHRPGEPKNEIGLLVDEIEVLDPEGKRKVLKREDLSFSYRKSNIDGNIVLRALFQLFPKDSKEIESEMTLNYEYRSTKQDLSLPSSGSIFKNPNVSKTAGQIIDECGLKGFRVGDIQVSEKHANYFVNQGQGTADDLSKLIETVQEKVYEKEGVRLETEVKIIN